jgi:hypothetical protein
MGNPKLDTPFMFVVSLNIMLVLRIYMLKTNLYLLIIKTQTQKHTQARPTTSFQLARLPDKPALQHSSVRYMHNNDGIEI